MFDYIALSTKNRKSSEWCRMLILMCFMRLAAYTWIVWESLACPRISRSAGSETKKNRGNSRRFFSRYPVSDFWQISSCSSRWGSSWDIVSSPVQHSTTFGMSCARWIIRCHDLSMFVNLFASFHPQYRNTVKISANQIFTLFHCQIFISKTHCVALIQNTSQNLKATKLVISKWGAQRSPILHTFNLYG